MMAMETVDPPPQAAQERPLGEIVNDAWQHAETLIRQELQLALADAQERVDNLKVELEGDVSKLKTELIAKAVGGAIAFIALLLVSATLVLLLAEVMKPWLAALIVSVVVGGGGFALLRRKLQLPDPGIARELIPKRAEHNVKQDVKAIQEAIK
jgi:nitrate/nitrite-specific signal transduction histidine kinase